MGIYKKYFSNAGVPATGLAPTWSSLKLVSDNSDLDPQPAISEMGGGWYGFTYAGADDLAGTIDGGATLQDFDRYKDISIDAVRAADIISETALILAESESHPTLAEMLAGGLALEDNMETHVVNAINSVASSLTRSEASILADGTEQELYINDAPADNWILDNIKLDLSVLQAGDSVTIRFYARMVAAGAYKLFDTQSFSDVQAVPAILVTGLANRYGLKITFQQTAGTYRTFVTEAMVIA